MVRIKRQMKIALSERGGADVMTEEDLRRQLRKIQEDREDFERTIRQFQKQEEENEDQDYRDYLETERMRESCTPEDRDIIQLLDEKQDLLSGLRRCRKEFADELGKEVRKKNTETDMKEEDIYSQLQALLDEREQVE